MSTTSNWNPVVETIRQNGRPDFRVNRAVAIGGGSINAAYRLDGEGVSYFVKINRAGRADMFEAEAQGLQEMMSTSTVRVPHPIGSCVAGDKAFLILEWVPLGGARGDSQRQLGRQLAAMHRVRQPFYGWHRENTIGSTPQINLAADEWTAFWRERRLRFQLDLAIRNGAGAAMARAGEVLASKLGVFFAGYDTQPSLLHGDLWGGNAGADSAGNPVVFDPACYYGDREADIAMTELFGGFGGDFYAAYDEAFPLDPGYGVRKTLYNLYHILNHFNLFGGGYVSQAAAMIDRLLAEAA